MFSTTQTTYFLKAYDCHCQLIKMQRGSRCNEDQDAFFNPSQSVQLSSFFSIKFRIRTVYYGPVIISFRQWYFWSLWTPALSCLPLFSSSVAQTSTCCRWWGERSWTLWKKSDFQNRCLLHIAKLADVDNIFFPGLPLPVERVWSMLGFPAGPNHNLISTHHLSYANIMISWSSYYYIIIIKACSSRSWIG